MKAAKLITVYEHDILTTGDGPGLLTKEQLAVLQAFYGEKGCRYYSLINNGVKFCEYVGVIQTGNLTIEVLPKMDKEKTEEQETWRNVLLGMLTAIGLMDVYASNSSDLKLKNCTFLDYYLHLFLSEVEKLVHQGLIKKYRKQEENINTLKGSLIFGKHLQQNLVHKELFYTRHTVYNQNHLIHQLVYKTLLLVEQISHNPELGSRIGALKLYFPAQNPIRVDDGVFSRVIYDRKCEAYRQCLEICRLLLLNYHPDVKRGTENVLAIMFDMNVLWERFVYVTIKRFSGKSRVLYAVTNKSSCNFWKQAG